MLWVKAFHIIFLVSWYAGLFYLPRLYVHHAMSDDQATRQRLQIMERKLFWFITPWAILTLVFGVWLLSYYDYDSFKSMTWLHIKLALVVPLVLFHIWCGKLMLAFRNASNPHSHVWFRWFNEFPMLLLIAIVLLVVLRPSF
ncbi:MAG: CopD family protein [Gammaproteobacteria bacterium]|nr:CopD family protein [Gammaproteobacteria bacterium]